MGNLMPFERVMGSNQNNMKNYGDLQSVAQNMKPTLWAPGEKIFLLDSLVNLLLGPFSKWTGSNCPIPMLNPKSTGLFELA